MEKKEYMKPTVQVVSLNNEDSILAASNEDTYTTFRFGSRKQNLFDDEEDYAD